MRQTLTALSGIIILIAPAVSFAGDCGDVNNSGSINILDITYLLNYLYKGGPEPDCGPTGTVTDIDGNTYLTVRIGDQWWMAENLEVTHYRNSDPIPNVTDPGAWHGLTTGAYCEYANDIANVAVYGRLYNWYAVEDSRNIAPEGWHVPTDADWQILTDCLGGNEIAGGKMKETGTTYWASPNIGATNESGFTGLPGGFRSGEVGSTYLGMAYNAYFWSSTESDSNNGRFRYLYYDNSYSYRSDVNKRFGLSVRCVKD